MVRLIQRNVAAGDVESHQAGCLRPASKKYPRRNPGDPSVQEVEGGTQCSSRIYRSSLQKRFTLLPRKRSPTLLGPLWGNLDSSAGPAPIAGNSLWSWRKQVCGDKLQW